jgi:hypothetical protein
MARISALLDSTHENIVIVNERFLKILEDQEYVGTSTASVEPNGMNELRSTGSRKNGIVHLDLERDRVDSPVRRSPVQGSRRFVTRLSLWDGSTQGDPRSRNDPPVLPPAPGEFITIMARTPAVPRQPSTGDVASVRETVGGRPVPDVSDEVVGVNWRAS